jgi:uncharacterized membrane protein
MSILSRSAEHLERDDRLDPLVGVFEGVSGVIPSGAVDDVLRGRPLGHALHPMLTDAPLGFWFSASALDLVGGKHSRAAASRLLGLGLLAAGPTALAGFADWRRLGPEARRVGAVHAVSNEIAVSLYAASWLARRRGHRAVGVLAALAGATAAGVGGYLGGHLVLAMKAPPRLT